MILGRMSAFYQFMSTMRPSFLSISSLIRDLFLLCLIFQPTLSLADKVSSEIASHAMVSNANQISSKDLATVRQAVLEQAEKQNLSKHETWLALLHYKRQTVSRDVISQADDENFFLHPEGKVDTKAELVASINAFFKETHSGHAQCLFPARWWWLKQQLNLSRAYDVQCPQLEAFMGRVAADKLVLVFPTMYLNNPGSTFGHTFLRFDAEGEANLLSQTLNYAARSDKSDNIFNYVRKGLFGGYTGFFRMRSYFETVQEYNNIENRDIWEYDLAFTKNEIEQLLRHVWEIKDVDFDYFFFKENCAYRLLALLDVVRAGMKLTTGGEFPVYAIPVDTVRALDEINLIKSRKLRASLVTRIDDYFLNDYNNINNKNGDTENASIAIDIATIENMVKSESILNYLNVAEGDRDKVEVLQQSYNILQFNNAASSTKAKNILELANSLSSKKNTKVNEDLFDQKFSESNKPNGNNEKKNYGKVSPEKGHDSIRVSAGFGKQNRRHYVDLRFRPAFHDLMDPIAGYVSGAAINSFEARFKWFSSSDKFNGSREGGSELRLESLSLLNITSLNPLRRWHKPLSWLLDVRFDRKQLNETTSVKNFLGRGGFGLSFQKKHFLPFLMLLGEGNLSSHYKKGYSVLLGLQAGMQMNFKSNRLLLSYQSDKAVSGFDLDRKVSQLQWQYDFQINHAVRLRYKLSEYDFFDDEDWSVNYHYYF